MIEGKKVLVMTLARAGSTGVKDKNIADLNGKPVLWYSVTEALKSKYADAVCVSTDSPKYAKIAEEAGIKVPFLRAPEVSTKSSTAAASSRWSTLKYEEYSGITYDYIIDFMCTNPFKTVEDLDACIEKLHRTGADTVVAVTRVWDGHPARIKQIIDDEIQDWPDVPEILESLRQDLMPPAYIRCGSVYAMRRHVLIDEGNRRGKVSRPYVMPPERVVNIDEPKDLLLARAMIKLQEEDRDTPSLGYRVLAISKIDDLPEVKRILSQIGIVDYRSGMQQSDLASTVHDYDALFVPTHLMFGKGVLNRPGGSRLKVICTPSGGTDHIDHELATQQNIEVISLDGEHELLRQVPSPAELAFNLMMNCAKQTIPAIRSVQQGEWNPTPFIGTELVGTTVGIVGMGSVGTIFSRYCIAFGMKVITYDPYKKVHDPLVSQYQHFDRLLAESDFVSIHAKLTDETFHMFGKKEFQTMKRTSYLINAARGAIVDQNALLDALEKKQIVGAALDVIEGEIEGNSSPQVLASRERLIDYARHHGTLIITPHLGGSTRAARQKRAIFAAEKLYQRMLVWKRMASEKQHA